MRNRAGCANAHMFVRRLLIGLGVVACVFVLWPRSKPVQTVPVSSPSSTSTIKSPAFDLQIQPDISWSPKEKKDLLRIINESYPVLVDCYGPPATHGPVTLQKVSGDVSDVIQTVNLDSSGHFHVTMSNNLAISGDASAREANLLHELVHYFHGPNIVLFAKPAKDLKNGSKQLYLHEAFEEGMAQWAASQVCRQLGYSQIDTVFEVSPNFNKPQFAFSGAFDTPRWLSALYPIRLGLMMWTINQWESSHPGFVKRFNKELYRTAKPPIDVQSMCLPIAEKITPGFTSWFKQQHIFQPSNAFGPQMVAFGDSTRVGVALFQRNREGEQPLSGEMVQVTITNGIDKQLTQVLPVNTEGIISIPFAERTPRYHVYVKWRDKTDEFSLGGL